MRYDQEELDVLCEQVSLLEYAEKTLEFKKVDSHNYACHCPLHVDKTPSLIIDDAENFFYCFSCGVSGNIINWLRTFEDLSFEEAVEKTADLADMDLSSFMVSDTVLFLKELSPKKNSVKSISERKILDFGEYEKFNTDIPEEWVKEGIPPDVLKKYEIRIDPRANRIVYPVYDNNDQLIGIKGRTRFENYKQLKIMKYMNYHKIGKVDYLTGMKQARKSILESKKIIIFEGLKSVMKMDSWGYHNCVSAETSHLNKDQIKLLIGMNLKEVTIAFDKEVNVRKLDLGLLPRFVNVYGIIDKYDLLNDKDAPVDQGREIWEELYESRVRL